MMSSWRRLSAFSSLVHFFCCEFKYDSKSPSVQANCSCIYLFICVILYICLTSLGLPGCNGGGVLWWGGGCTLPLSILHPGSLCLYCHAVCHSQGMETNCLQVSSFSASLPAWASSFPHPAAISISMQLHPLYETTCACVWIYFYKCTIATNTNSIVWVQGVGLRNTVFYVAYNHSVPLICVYSVLPFILQSLRQFSYVK